MSVCRFKTLLFVLIFISCKPKNVEQANINSTNSTFKIEIPEGYTIGDVKEDSPEELEAFRKSHKRIGEVRLNSLGAKRVQEQRSIENKNLNLTTENLELNSVPFGEETVAENEVRDFNLTSQFDTQLLPAEVNNSILPSFPPIGDQGIYGSCAPFSVTYYQATSNLAMVRGYAINKDASNALSVKFVYNQGNEGTVNGMGYHRVYRVLQSEGAPSQKTWPYATRDMNYKEWPLTENIWNEAITNRSEYVEYIDNSYTPEVITKLKKLLADGYLIATDSQILGWTLLPIKRDPSSEANNSHVGERAIAYVSLSENSGHGLTIVGYNDNIWVDINYNGVVDVGEKGAFLLANSWGVYWGNKGFIWASYDSFGKTSRVVPAPQQVSRMVAFGSTFYHLPFMPATKPKLTARITANTANRFDSPLTFGISEVGGEYGTNSMPQPFMFNSYRSYKTAEGFYTYGYFGGEGGPYAYDGTNTAVDANFVVDLSEIFPNKNVTKTIWLKIQALSTDVVIKKFSLVDYNNQTIAVISDSVKVKTGQTKYVSVNYAFVTPPPTPIPTATPSPTPTIWPSPSPSPKSTATSSPKPTASPSPKPTASPSPKPTASPSPKPTASPSPKPTVTVVSTKSPSPIPTSSPVPTVAPLPIPSPTPTLGDGFVDIGPIKNGAYTNYCLASGKVPVLGSTPAVWAEPCTGKIEQIVQYNFTKRQLRFKSNTSLCFATVKGGPSRTYLIACNNQDTEYYHVYDLDSASGLIKHPDFYGVSNYCLGYTYDWLTAYWLFKGEYPCSLNNSSSEFKWNWSY